MGKFLAQSPSTTKQKSDLESLLLIMVLSCLLPREWKPSLILLWYFFFFKEMLLTLSAVFLI